MRAFVFSLDALLAVFVFSIILASVFLFYQQEQSRVADSNTVIIASDIISALDEKKVFDSLDPTLIANNLSLYIPPNIVMSLKLQVYDDNINFQQTKQVNADIVSDHYQGKWLLIVGNITQVQNYVVVDYKVGFK